MFDCGCDPTPRAPQSNLEYRDFGIPSALTEWPLIPATQLQFKAWRCFTDPGSVKDLEVRLQFRFPREFIEQCRKCNGGVLSGLLVFNAPECRGLVIDRFLGFGDPSPGAGPFNDDIITVAIAGNACFLSGSLSSYIPFAHVSDSIGEEEQQNAWNGEGFLAFQKSDGSVNLVSPSRGKAVHVAADFASFLKNAAYLCRE